MSDNNLVCAATLSGLVDVLADIECVRLRDVPPSTTLLVRTVNSQYRVVITQEGNVSVQGGAFFPEPTAASLDGASIGGSSLRVGYICVGLLVEIRAGGRRIVTSPVRSIAVVPPPRGRVH
jgi:hypothetical protein